MVGLTPLNNKDFALPNLPPCWHGNQRSVRGLSAAMANWLFHPGSLTRRLRQCCGERLWVQILWQGWGRPSRDEASALQLRLDARTWIREVRLLCEDQAWVFARTLIPTATLHGRGRALQHLGSRPLGEVLFNDPAVCRAAVEVAKITARQRLYQRALASAPPYPALLWARRSRFHLGQQPLLVCEIFLPDLPASPPPADRIEINDKYQPL